MSFIKRLENIGKKRWHIWFEDNAGRKLYFLNPNNIENKIYFDEIFEGTKQEALAYMRKQHAMMIDYEDWRIKYPYSSSNCSSCWDHNRKEYICTPNDCPIKGSHKTDRSVVLSRIYIKGSYEQRELLKYIGASYDSHYCRWYIYKNGYEKVKKVLIETGFEFYSEEEFEEYMMKFDPNAHIPTPSKRVICLETKEAYSSINRASERTGICKGSISNVCKGKGKTAGGYHWMYLEDYKTKENKEYGK